MLLKSATQRPLEPIDLHELLDLRYKPKKKKFVGCKKNPVFKKFDWVIWLPDSARSCRIKTLRPKTILCLAHKKSFKMLNMLCPLIKNATIVIAGGDTNLSIFLDHINSDIINNNRILYEAKDVSHPRIKSFCMGFNSFYLKKVGVSQFEQTVRRFEQGKYKKSGILAAWGEHWPQLDNKLSDRKNAATFLKNCPFISRQNIPPADYWEKLAQSLYLLAPAGQGIQAPKLAEAWLVGTVPIVTSNPCFEDLRDRGYPLMIIDHWSDLTTTKIKKWESELHTIDWNSVRSQLSSHYFFSMIKSSTSN